MQPDREDERARIEALGGKVINWMGFRVSGVLAMSRSIGMLINTQVIIVLFCDLAVVYVFLIKTYMERVSFEGCSCFYRKAITVFKCPTLVMGWVLKTII